MCILAFTQVLTESTSLPTAECDFNHLLFPHQLETVRLPSSQPELASISEQKCMTVTKLHLTKLVSTG